MTRDNAELLMKRLVALNGPFNGVIEAIEQISDQDEKRRFRKEIAEIIAITYTNLTVPVTKQYPELDPLKDLPS